MAIVNLTATKRPNRSFPGHGSPGILEQFATVACGAADSDTSTYTLFTGCPSTARLWPGSWINNDDLATGNSPDLDIGIFGESSQITDDDDAIASALAGETAGEKAMCQDAADWGKQLWEYVNGQTTDPGGFFTIKITIDTADLDQAGDINALLRLKIED